MATAVKISLIPSVLDLELYAGDGVSLVFTLTDGVGQPLDVTGNVVAQIRGHRADDDPLVDFTADLTDGASGVVRMSLTGVQTALLTPTSETQFKGVWDMQWTRTNGEPVTVLQGAITCDPDVTR